MKNPNHPKKGSNIKVAPIRDIAVIQRIKRQLSGHPRNLCLFAIGINTAFRASDLLRIQVGHVRNLQRKQSVEFKEKKTGNHRLVTFNDTCIKVINDYLKTRPDTLDENYLFVGLRGVLTVKNINWLIKQ